jgi:hypothetical protein
VAAAALPGFPKVRLAHLLKIGKANVGGRFAHLLKDFILVPLIMKWYQ